ncbi:NAC domain-containing protein 53-like [Prosopis cineraria]|uniref:NAC domain-containing protein 53-like n=1 Tax=Prosopis cineraria TaxID=364024 RepID=UPI0024103D36|nr:NAC domain-containing protein 53-like [Prosopis cineraria]
MGPDSPASLAPGFRFHPTDEELVRYYLRRKVSGRSFRFDPIAVIDIYKSEPWDLPCQSKLKSRDLEWYFFSALDKKYGNGSRTNRATEKGYWKTTGKDRPVRHSSRTVGMKKTLVYHGGRAPRGTRTNWVMHEYRLADEELAKAGIQQDAFVLCRIFHKSGTGPKNGEQYGAPFIEEEWQDDDVAVAPLLGDEAATDEIVVGDDAFVETDDLDQCLDMGVASERADHALNFYYGECSSYPEHCQELIADQKPLVGTAETYEPRDDLLLNKPEQLALDSKLVKDGIKAEASHEGCFLNHNYTFDETYLDATDTLLASNGSFLETADLVNPVEANPAETGAADADVLEYLTYFNDSDDVSQYISFDSPGLAGSEYPETDQGPPLTQLNMGEESKNILMASKIDVEAHSSEEASYLKQRQEASKLVSGNTYPFMKQDSHLLGSIPSPPAFTSEFPPKEIALRHHSTGQCSNSAHVTAGMIRITDFTVRGNRLDWMLGKNGEFSVVISSCFWPDVNPVALVPISGLLSGKSAFVVSHGWIFLVFFSVLILSLSFKVGSFMYPSK